MARTLKATGLYKSQRFIGSTITINDETIPPVTYPGTIVEVYWASDAQGLNRTTTGTFDDARYLIVKTKDIPDVVTVYLNSDELSTDDLEEGVLNSAVNIPLLVDSSGNGFGFYKILTLDEDDMAFRNATWVKYNYPTRQYGTVYTNTSGQAIAVSIEAAEYNGANQGGPTALYVGDKKVQQGYELFTIVPAGATYRVDDVGEGEIISWHELRKAGTT